MIFRIVVKVMFFKKCVDGLVLINCYEKVGVKKIEMRYFNIE